MVATQIRLYFEVPGIETSSNTYSSFTCVSMFSAVLDAHAQISSGYWGRCRRSHTSGKKSSPLTYCSGIQGMWPSLLPCPPPPPGSIVFHFLLRVHLDCSVCEIIKTIYCMVCERQHPCPSSRAPEALGSPSTRHGRWQTISLAKDPGISQIKVRPGCLGYLGQGVCRQISMGWNPIFVWAPARHDRRARCNSQAHTQRNSDTECRGASRLWHPGTLIIACGQGRCLLIQRFIRRRALGC